MPHPVPTVCGHGTDLGTPCPRGSGRGTHHTVDDVDLKGGESALSVFGDEVGGEVVELAGEDGLEVVGLA